MNSEGRVMEFAMPYCANKVSVRIRGGNYVFTRKTWCHDRTLALQP